MTTSKSSDWGGAFHNPIMKHRDYCGDITNHFEIKSVVQLTDDEIEEHDEGMESEFLIDELEQIGNGSIAWLVTVGFIEDSSGDYEFVVWSDTGGEADITQALAESLLHP